MKLRMNNRLVIPMSAFEIPWRDKKSSPVRMSSLTLNKYVEISGLTRGRPILNRHKAAIQYKIQPIVVEAITNGLEIEYPAQFRFEWYLKDKRTDLDNIAFMHKFVFDAFQKVSVQDKEFMPGDGLKFVAGLSDVFAGIDKGNERVEISWHHVDSK